MPQRSAVSQLPDDVRSELEQRLVHAGFAGYEALADWLAEQGFEISKSSIHRYGQQFEQRLSALKFATDQAKAIAEASEDDEGAMNEALIRLVQQQIFSLLMEVDHEAPDLAKIARAAADLVRSSISQKKFAEQVQAKIDAKAADFASRNGLSAKQTEDLRRELLGVVA